MAIKITEDGNVIYENEPTVERELLPNITDGEQYAKQAEEALERIEEIAESIPEDYTQLIQDVATLEDSVSDLEEDVEELQNNYTPLSEDVAELKNDLNQFPNGNYPQMGAGYANQLVSGLKKEDQTPYNFRRIPYDATLEEVEKIVGGTVVNNQLVENGNFASASGWNDNGNVSLSIANNIATMTTTIASGDRNFSRYINIPSPTGHKLFVSVDIKVSEASTPQAGVYGVYARKSLSANTWETCLAIDNVTSTALSGYAVVYAGSMALGGTVDVKNFYAIDLTQMFGATIADYIYSLETATAGAGVAWLKTHFPKQFDAGYQAYDAGTLKSIEGLSGKKTVGFNQWDEEHERANVDWSTYKFVPSESGGRLVSKNFIPVLSGTAYYITRYANNILVGYADENSNGIHINNNSGVFTVPDGIYFIKFGIEVSTYGTTYNHDICINFSDPTKNGTYEPYEAHSYALDSDVVLRGIPKLNSNNQLYYDGDEYLPDGTVNRRYEMVVVSADDVTQAGTASTGVPWASFSLSREGVIDSRNALSTKYLPTNGAPSTGGWFRITGSIVYVYDNAITDLSVAKALLNGLEVLYPLATPTAETADPYQTPQIISPDGTEEYIYEDGAFELPVGHSSDYPVDVSGQLDDILDTPSANGTYTLKATVTDGAVTYSWVADA